MADLAQLESALVKADAAGDTEGARILAGEIRKMRGSGPVKQYKIGAEGLPDAVKAVAGDFNPLTQMAVGGKAAWDNAAMRLKQLVGGELTPEETNTVRANRALLQESAPAALGDLAVTMGATGGPVSSLVRGVGGMAGKYLPQFLAPTIGAAAGGAAVSSTTQPVLEGESGMQNAGMGAGISAALDAVLRGGARVVQPIVQTPAVKALLEKDIVPTMGQSAGGFLKSAEERLGSVPGVGDLIRNAQGRARNEFNRAELNLAMPPGREVTQTGNAGMAEVKDALSSAYDALFKGVAVKPDGNLFKAILAARQSPTVPLNADGVKNFDAVVQKVMLERLGKGQIDAGDMKAQIIGDLGKEARKFLNSSTRAEQTVGEALMAARNEVQNWLVGKVGQTSPSIAAELAKIDPAYATSLGLKKATNAAAAQDGVFTPLQAIRRTTEGSEANTLARNAQTVLASRVPDSGTPSRALAAMALGIGGAGANEYYGGPGYLSALALAPLLYSRAGSRYMAGDLIPGQSQVSSVLRQSSPYVAPFGQILLDQQ